MRLEEGLVPLTVIYNWLVLPAQFIGLSLLAQLAVRRLERSAREQGLHYL